MSNKRVCHITIDHPPYDGRIFKKECISLYNSGYEVYLVQKDVEGLVDGIRMVKFSFSTKKYPSFLGFLRAKDAYDKALELDCDIYHFHEPAFFPYARWLKKKGKTVIYDCHEERIEEYLIEVKSNNKLSHTPY